jgi:hypothetical protein
LVTIASSTTGSVEVLVARMPLGLHDLLELGEQRLLDGEVLDDRLDHQVAVGDGAQVVGRGDAAEDRGLLVLGGLAALDGLGEALVDAEATIASADACERDRTTTS